MSLPSYPAYKATGIEWLTSVPQNWELSRLGFEAWVRARLGWKGLKAEEYVDSGYAFLATPNIKGKAIDFQNVNYITQERYDESPEIKLAVGDVLLAKDGSTLGTVNVVRELPFPATVNSSIAVITPHASLSGVFLLYLLQSDFLVNTIQRIKGGMGVPHLFQEDLNKFHIPVPPIEEQSIIAAFLDHETAKIDLLVSEQEKLLTLLAEKRQATISHAVTRGLNPNASMKRSGVTWLGMVPAHWTVCALRRALLRIEQGWSPECFNRPSEGTEWGVLKTGCVNGGVFNAVENKALPETLEPVAALEIRDGDLLMSRASGSPKLVGSAAYISKPPPRLMLSDKIFRLHLRHWVLPRFLAAALNSAALRLQIEASISGAEGLANNLPQSSLKDFWVAVPPEREQEEIVAFVDAETRRLDILRTEVEHTIELLKERRRAVISAAVTGKIDVRNASPQELAA